MDKRKYKIYGYFTGMGYWTRCNPVFITTKGKPKRISKSVKQLVFSKRQEHSKKPTSLEIICRFMWRSSKNRTVC